jgi:hypothetical protein
MRHFLNSSVVVLGSILFAGCAHHSTMRGTVAMKVSGDEAHVCMGDNEVKAGDKVALFKNVCKGTSSGREASGNRTCEKKKIGDGEVTRTLNEHYSVVKVSPGVVFDEGTVVEKQ